jgi:hypothetical protein
VPLEVSDTTGLRPRQRLPFYFKTVNVVESVVLPDAALMVVVPMATADASPVFEIVATAVFDEVHVTELDTSRTVPSAKVAVAENWMVGWLARLTLGFAGAISSEVMGDDSTVAVVEPDAVPDVAVIVAEPGEIPVAIPEEFTRRMP